jgi:hypothetical protein
MIIDAAEELPAKTVSGSAFSTAQLYPAFSK